MRPGITDRKSERTFNDFSLTIRVPIGTLQIDGRQAMQDKNFRFKTWGHLLKFVRQKRIELGDAFEIVESGHAMSYSVPIDMTH